MKSLVTALLFCLITASSVANADNRPNIVVIMTDDLDVGQLNTLITNGLMPNLVTHLVSAGTTFENSFVSTSLCCPSRATFLTGQYSHNHHVLDNRPPGGVTAFDDSSTLATWLSDAGYFTGHVGKYLNGYGADYDPKSPRDNPNYIPPGWSNWQGLIDPSTYRMYRYAINDNGKKVTYGGAPEDYQTDVLAQRVSALIDKAKASGDAKPFFLVVTPPIPHVHIDHEICHDSSWDNSPLPAPRHIGTLPDSIQLPRPQSFNEADVADKPFPFPYIPLMTSKDIECASQQYRDRLESMRAVDDMIGTVVTKLSDAGALDKTVLIFTSDNGWFSGEHRLTEKKWFFEESIRIPLIVRAPGYPAQISKKFVSNNDLAPTVAAFANIVPPATVDGRSIIPLLANPDYPWWRKQLLVEFGGNEFGSMRDGADLRLSGGTDFRDIVPSFFAVRTSVEAVYNPNIVFARMNDGQVQYYDLSSDPYQLESQHGKLSAGRLTVLESLLNDLASCAGAGCRALEDWDGKEVVKGKEH